MTSPAEDYFEAGQWDDALAELEPAAGRRGAGSLARVHGLIALIAGHRDDRVTAEEHLAAARDQAGVCFGEGAPSLYLFRARALAAERAGRVEQAVTELAQILDPGFAAGMAHRYLLLPMLTRLALAAGDAVTAAAAGRAAAAEVDCDLRPAKAAAAAHCRGLADADPGLLLAAAESYREAGRAFDRAQALEDAAVLLAGGGDLPAARRTFREAAMLYRAVGAAWDLRRADARLRRHGIGRAAGGRRAGSTEGWDALTPTETRVAYLVAGGRSNPEIAAELFLSRNTVQTHVSHILAKLGARSRAEIIRQALRRPPPD